MHFDPVGPRSFLILVFTRLSLVAFLKRWVIPATRYAWRVLPRHLSIDITQAPTTHRVQTTMLDRALSERDTVVRF